MLRFVVIASAVVACSSDDSSPPVAPSDNGVDDVRQACEIRLAWRGATTSQCTSCLAAAANPPCACTDTKAYGGRCESQQNARARAPCDGVEACRFACPISDCGCLDACYAQKDACRAATSALEGCVAKVCAEECAAP